MEQLRVAPTGQVATSFRGETVHSLNRKESQALLERLADAEDRFGVSGPPVPRPPHWSGFRLSPSLIEFWQDGAFRLHDRLVYRREGEAWRTERLFP